MIDGKRLVRNLNAYCVANGISKKDLSDATGISTATLSQWRNGMYQPSAKKIQSIERLIGMPVERFITMKSFEIQPDETKMPVPRMSKDDVSFPVIGGVAAGYDHIAYEDWTGESIEIPRSYLHGGSPREYFVLRVLGDSMYPDYRDGDHVLVLRQSTMDRSGQVGVVIYGGENATLKRIEYVMGEDWMTLHPINPQYPPVTIRGEDLEHCTVLGVAKMVIRELNQ